MSETPSPQDWESFCAAHYETVRYALIGMSGVPRDRVDDLAQGFIVKLLEKVDLTQMPTHHAQLRRWLFTSLKHYVIDEYRRSKGQVDRIQLESFLDPPNPERCGDADRADADTLYALGILHLALQRLRFHCEATGKPEVWTIFEGAILNGKLKGREAEMRNKLQERYPGRNGRFLDNRLTTAKRTLRRLIPELIPGYLTDKSEYEERFAEWKGIIQAARAAGVDRFFAAVRIPPVPGSEMSEYHSANMIVPPEESVPELSLEGVTNELEGDDPVEGELFDDELSLLLSFRLSMSFGDYLYVDGKRTRVNGNGPLVPFEKFSKYCLLDLVEQRNPTGAKGELGCEELLELLRRLKRVAKWFKSKHRDYVPEKLSILIYNLASALALVRCNNRIDTLDDEQLSYNLRWSFELPWLDDRLRPIFRGALATLGYIP